MPEISQREKQIDWICRVLMTIDVFAIIAGYVSYFQTKRQLISPLIPKSTLYQIMADGGDVIMKTSLLLTVPFLAGLWFYSFTKKMMALVLFSLTVILYISLFFFF